MYVTQLKDIYLEDITGNFNFLFQVKAGMHPNVLGLQQLIHLFSL
jgi:hypothetical protein